MQELSISGLAVELGRRVLNSVYYRIRDQSIPKLKVGDILDKDITGIQGAKIKVYEVKDQKENLKGTNRDTMIMALSEFPGFGQPYQLVWSNDAGDFQFPTNGQPKL